MADLPANFAGGLELLLQRLRTGTASKADQEWAARLLTAAARLPAKAATPWAETTAARDHRIYLDVLEAAGPSPDEAAIDGACAQVAGRYRVSRERVDTGSEQPPPMAAATVKNKYLEQRRIDLALEALKALPPWERIGRATDEDWNRLRQEHARVAEAETQHAREFAAALPPADESAAYQEWLAVLSEYQTKD